MSQSQERVHDPASHRRRSPALLWFLMTLLLLAVAGTAMALVSSLVRSGDAEVPAAAGGPSSEGGAAPAPASTAAEDGDALPQPDALASVPPGTAPQVMEVRPATGAMNGGEAVVIAGSGFREPVLVSLGGRAAPSVTVINDETIRVVTPPGLEGPAQIQINTGSGASLIVDGLFSYVDQASRVIMAVRPTLGTGSGGTEVTIVGTGFADGARVVIGGEPAVNVTVHDSLRITATTPAHDAGLVDVVVRNPGMPAAILPSAFEFVVGPTVTGMAPTDISRDGGTRITITGTGFEPGAIVTINGIRATGIEVIDAATIRAVAPLGVVGPAVLTVMNPEQPPATLVDAAFYVLPPDVPSDTSPIGTSPVDPAPAPTLGPTDPLPTSVPEPVPVPEGAPAPAG